jgi:hypothetical protein
LWKLRAFGLDLALQKCFAETSRPRPKILQLFLMLSDGTIMASGLMPRTVSSFDLVVRRCPGMTRHRFRLSASGSRCSTSRGMQAGGPSSRKGPGSIGARRLIGR